MFSHRFYLLGLLALLTQAATGEPSDPWTTVYPEGDTSCANGADYRFHVRAADLKKLMIFFNGGGACWNTHMCDPANNSNDVNSGMFYRTRPTDEYGNDPRSMGGAFDLTNDANPFADWSQLFVVYCTGDIHLGGKDQSYRREDGSELKIRHRGKLNAIAALDHVSEKFPEAETVLVSGSSAGAVASHYYAPEVATRHPDARITVLADGAGGYRAPIAQTPLWDSWGTFDAMPAWWDSKRFNAANTRLIDLIYPAVEANSAIHFYHYDTAYDKAQQFFQNLLGFPTLLYDNLVKNNSELSRDIPNFGYYVGKGDFHTILRFDNLYHREVRGTKAVDWIRALANGEDPQDVSCGSSAQCR